MDDGEAATEPPVYRGASAAHANDMDGRRAAGEAAGHRGKYPAPPADKGRATAERTAQAGYPRASLEPSVDKGGDAASKGQGRTGTPAADQDHEEGEEEDGEAGVPPLKTAVPPSTPHAAEPAPHRTPSADAAVQTDVEETAGVKGWEDGTLEGGIRLGMASTNVPSSATCSSQALYAGQALFPSLADGTGFRVCTRALFDPALAIGVTVARALFRWRAAHSRCNPGCCRASGVCSANAELAQDPPAHCPCSACLWKISASEEGLVVTNKPGEEAAMYSQWFGRIRVRRGGIYCVPAPDLNTLDDGTYHSVAREEELLVLESRPWWRLDEAAKETFEQSYRERGAFSVPRTYAQDPARDGRRTACENHVFSTLAYIDAMADAARNPRLNVEEGVPDYQHEFVKSYVDHTVGRAMADALRLQGCAVDVPGRGVTEELWPTTNTASLVLSMPNAMPLFSYGLSAMAPATESPLHCDEPEPFGVSLCGRFCVLTAFPLGDRSTPQKPHVRPGLSPGSPRAQAPRRPRPQTKQPTPTRTGLDDTCVVGRSSRETAMEIYTSKLGIRTRTIGWWLTVDIAHWKASHAPHGDFVVVRDDVGYGFPRGLENNALRGEVESQLKGTDGLGRDATNGLVADDWAVALGARVHFAMDMMGLVDDGDPLRRCTALDEAMAE